MQGEPAGEELTLVFCKDGETADTEKASLLGVPLGLLRLRPLPLPSLPQTRFKTCSLAPSILLRSRFPQEGLHPHIATTTTSIFLPARLRPSVYIQLQLLPASQQQQEEEQTTAGAAVRFFLFTVARLLSARNPSFRGAECLLEEEKTEGL